MAATFDFSSPFLAAAIIDPLGNRWPLWLKQLVPEAQRTSRTGANLQVESIPYLSELSVKLDLAFAPVIKAVLTPPFAEGRKLLDSSIIEFGYSRLEVQFGYAGGAPAGVVLSNVFSGQLFEPDIQFGTDITITLNAQGDGGFDAATTASTKTYSGVTRRELIQTLASGPGGTRKLKVNTTEADADADVRARLDFAVDVTGGGYTNWFLIQLLARQVRCWAVIVGDELLLRPRNLLLSSAPTRVFTYFDYPAGAIGPSTGVFPILSATSPAKAVYFSGIVQKGLIVRDIASATGAVIASVIDDPAVSSGRTGRGARALDIQHASSRGVITGPEPGTEDGRVLAPGAPDDPVAVATAEADHQEHTGSVGIRLELTTLGIPDLFPGEVFGVRGLGRRFDSVNYGIFEVTHTIGGSGYETQIMAESNIAPYATEDTILEPDASGPVSPAAPPVQAGDTDRVTVG